MCKKLQEALLKVNRNKDINVLRDSREKLKRLEKNQLCYSYCETPDIVRNGKPIYTNEWLWCHASKWNNLHEVTKRYGYSNAIFKYGKRAAINVVYLGNLLIYDYDYGITLDAMKDKIQTLGVSALIVTTLNHQKEKKGVVCDRFRLILQLEKCIGSDINTSMMGKILQEVDNFLKLGKVYDTSCKTVERFYSPASMQSHFYFEGMTLDLSEIISAVKNPKQKPDPRRAAIQSYSEGDLSLKDMREYVREHITYDIVVRELEAKDLIVSRKGRIYLEKKHVGNIHPDTRMIADWASSKHMDIIGALDKYYNESYTDNTQRLYEELKCVKA